MESCVSAALLMVCCVLRVTCSNCNQTQYFDMDGNCQDCLRCGPGEQLSEDCGYGDGGGAHCLPCGEGEFSEEWGLAACLQCSQCSLLNRLERVPCQPQSNTQCGPCLRGFYEMRQWKREKESPCLPCFSPTGGVRKECRPPPQQKTPAATSAGEEPAMPSMVVIGVVSAASAFSLVLLLWGLLFIAELIKLKLKSAAPPGNPSVSPVPPDSLEKLLPARQPGQEREPEQRSLSSEDCPRSLYSLSSEKESPPASIVINVTTNIKPPSQGVVGEWEGQDGLSQETQHSLQEMEHKLQDICRIAKGRTLEEVDYDTVQELSLLVDSGGRGTLRGLARALGVPPEVINNLHGFQELFQYLRTSTYTLLPQLALAAAALHRSEIVARIHQGLVATEATTPR